MSIILDGSLPSSINVTNIIDSTNPSYIKCQDSNDYDNQLCLSGNWQFAKGKKTDLEFKYTWTSTDVNIDLINYVSFLDRSRLRTYRRRKKNKLNQIDENNNSNNSNNNNNNNSNNIINNDAINPKIYDNNSDNNQNNISNNDNILSYPNPSDNSNDITRFEKDNNSSSDFIENNNNTYNQDENEEMDTNGAVINVYEDENHNDYHNNHDDDGDDYDNDDDDVENNDENNDDENYDEFHNDDQENNLDDDNENEGDYEDISEQQTLNLNYQSTLDSTNNDDDNKNELINQDATFVKINRVHPFLGLWKGSFNVKNATGGEDCINEEFFFHKVLNTKTQPELLNLPEDPYFSYTALRHTDISLYLHTKTEISNSELPELTKSEEEIAKDEEAEENKAKVMTSGSRQPVLIGFGRNIYGRFTVTALLDRQTGKFICEKKYLLSKSGSYRRHKSSDELETPRLISQRVRQAPSYNRFANDEVGLKRKRNSFPLNKLEKGLKMSLSPHQQYYQQQQQAQLQLQQQAIKFKEEYYENDDYRIAFYDEETGEVYEGGWMKGLNGGKRHGRGICVYNDGTMYEGQWQNGKCQGRGQLMTVNRQIIYTGEWIDGFMQGQGTYNFENGDRYIGDWKEGNRHGKGEYLLSNGCKYTGEWNNNKRHGKGLFVWADESYYEGSWENDNRNGQGLLHLTCGFVYDGYWLNGFMEGRGNCTFQNGFEYQGTYKSGLREGRGSITFPEGAIYEGRFKDDKIDGHGTIKLIKSVPGNAEGEIMIPISIQADMRRIHLKAGFGEEAGFH